MAGWRFCELLGDNTALAGLRMEVVEELVGSRFHWKEDEGTGDAGGEHQFLLQLQALEFRGPRPFVFYLQAEADAGRNLNRFGEEAAILHQQLESRHVVGQCYGRRQKKGKNQGKKRFHDVS